MENYCRKLTSHVYTVQRTVLCIMSLVPKVPRRSLPNMPKLVKRQGTVHDWSRTTRLVFTLLVVLEYSRRSNSSLECIS